MPVTDLKLDVIGDVHGELPALLALGRELGYDVDADWQHPEHRIPVFVGDLVDRGAHSLEVVERVEQLVARDRAACLMGNHEYNLVAYHLKLRGYERPKRSNRATIEDFARHPARWERALSFLEALPIAFALDDLRIIHACWHAASYEAVKEKLGPHRGGSGGALKAYVALESPFEGAGLVEGLFPWDENTKIDAPQELLLKGFEVAADAPFRDAEGTIRHLKRATWWTDEAPSVLRDARTQVFGHYWNLPPVEGQFCPPHPSGHPELRAWQARIMPKVPDRGRRALDADARYVCVDFNGVTADPAGTRACVGALRWPEREIAWATAPKTSVAHGVQD